MSHLIRNLAAACLAMCLASPASAGEFEYSIPAGWIDLRAAITYAGSRDTSNIPQRLLQDAGGGQYAVAAADPNGSTKDKAGATFNAVEMPGAGRVTIEVVKKGVDELVGQLEAAGLRVSVIDATLTKLNGVNVGMTTIDVDTPRGTRTLRQYLITGRKNMTVLSYGAPKAEFDRYLPVFEASARATKGGYEAGWFNWKRILVNAGIGALFFGMVGFVMGYVRKRRDAAEQGETAGDAQPAASKPGTRSAPPAKKTSRYVWACPGCGNPVPARLDQCRCGTARPA
jgi:hypothetical protein